MRRQYLLFDGEQPTAAFAHFLQDVQVPGKTLQEIDDALQARFFQRGPDGQPLERWELREVELSCPPARFQRHLQLCGFGMKTIPSPWMYRYAAWPGALLVRVADRLKDLVDAWESGVRWEETVVFGGKRPLQEERENPEEEIKLLVWNHMNPPLVPADWDCATELEMMRWLWGVADLPTGLYETAVFVDVPMKPPAIPGGQPIRPNTEDTIRAWLESSDPDQGTLLLSSGAPYGMAQEVAFEMVLGRRFTIETFGHAATELSMEVFMREVAGAVNRIRRGQNI